MYNAGQVCCATSRILIHASIYHAFVEAFKNHTSQVSVIGNPFERSVFQGPQVTKVQLDRILAFASIGEKEGATLVSGGRPCTALPTGTGFFVQPTIFKDVKPSMQIYREEVFGPFVVMTSFRDEEEAIALANDSIYGLGSALFTQDLTRAHRIARRIDAGMVWINSSNDSDFRVAFGGVKQSGIGRELGEAGLHAYTQTKSVHVNLGTKL